MKPIDIYRNKLSEEDVRFIEQIEADADNTPARDKGLAVHVGAIEKLRAKGYSYRDIAAWFGGRNIKVTHVDVWRAHKNNVPTEELFGLADNDEEWREYISKKTQGNVTKYEDAIPETGTPPSETEKPAAELTKPGKKPVKRSRKATSNK